MTTYRLDRAPALAVAGVLLLVAALTGFVTFLLGSRVSGALTLLLLVVAALVVLRPPVLLRLDEEMLRTRGGGRAPWKRVEDVKVTDGLLLLTLESDDPATPRVVRVTLSTVGGRAAELVREVHDRLNAAHGYRRFG